MDIFLSAMKVMRETKAAACSRFGSLSNFGYGHYGYIQDTILPCFRFCLIRTEVCACCLYRQVWRALNATLTLTSTGHTSRPQPRLSAPDVNEKNNRKERIYMSLTPRHVRYKTSVRLALPNVTSSSFFPHHG
jgi:hypothetical protein